MSTRVSSWNGVKYTYSGPVEMVTVECPRCGVLFGITDRLVTHLRSSRETFYCPHGHSASYTESTETQLKRQLASTQEEARIAWATATQRREEADAERRRHGATKGQLTKARKRAAAGVCPCCHRTFQQVARHMASQHPGFDPEQPA